jgi:predicted O-linked N-acetylglucosamine transferase (SPINDLY family)
MEALVALYGQRRLEEVEQRAHALTRRFPLDGFGWKVLGLVLSESGHPDQAIEPLQKAARLLPHDAEAHNNLGNALIEIRRPSEAEASLRRALAIKSDFALAHFNLGNALKDQRRLVEAATSYRHVLALKPDYMDVYNNLGNVLKDQGRLVEAASAYRRTLTIRPDFPSALSNLVFTLNCGADTALDTRLAEARRYGGIMASKVQGRYQQWLFDPDARRLRIGFVSGDLRKHPVGYFLQSLLGAIDRSRFELFAYTTSRDADELSDSIKPFFSAWTSLLGLSDSAAAARIHADGINILIDLSGHTAHNRLPVFAWKPAPVQVAWLGYFATTGLAEMDYILADDVGVPPENRCQFTEKVWYLPDTRLCFTPPDGAPDVSALPALTNGHATFGCFQNLAKLSDAVLTQWARILGGLPSARLRIQNRSFGDKLIRDQFMQRLNERTIDTSRVTLHGPVPRKAYLAAHSEVDLLLDTFAFPGGTTTCEALWMGVPTLTLAGDTLLARQGASMLAAAGLPHWVATSEDDYVAKAIAFAGDLPKLAVLRSALRAQVSASPLFDAPRFAGRFQDALSEMWRLFLSGQ